MAGSVVVTSHEGGRRRVRRIVLTATANAATDGTYPDTVIPPFEGRIVEVQTNPGPAATVITLATSAATDDIIDTAAPHGFVAGTPVRFKTLTGGTGLVIDTTYYVSATSLGASTFRVSAAASPDTPLGFSVDISAGTVTADMFDAPTDNYDITLTDANGFDRLQGLAVDRDITNSEVKHIVFSGTSINPIVSLDDVLTLSIANNSVKRAVVVVTLMYAPV